MVTLPPGFNPSATGRGPRWHWRWYEVKTTDGATIVGQWTGGDYRAKDRAEHWLTFEDDEYIHEIPYGEILSCLPMNARLRYAEIDLMAERDQCRREQRYRRNRRT
jgi:hypothetical protein